MNTHKRFAPNNLKPPSDRALARAVASWWPSFAKRDEPPLSAKPLSDFAPFAQTNTITRAQANAFYDNGSTVRRLVARGWVEWIDANTLKITPAGIEHAKNKGVW